MDEYRFYLPDLTAQPPVLPEDQANHALRVLRLTEGAPVVVFDGRGGWASAVLHPAERQVRLELTSSLQQDDPPRHPLTLATAVPKGDRAEWLMEQASQLNVSIIQWLDTHRGVVRPKESGGKIEKWRRLAIESAKQCGRTHLLKIQPMRSLKEVLQNSAAGELRLCLDPRSPTNIQQVLPESPGPITAFIGPEGGWSPEELELQAAAPNLISVRLTPTILRIETACVAIAAYVNCR